MYSRAPNLRPVEGYTTINTYLSTLASISPSGRETVLEIGENTFVANTSGFLGTVPQGSPIGAGPYLTALEVMNEFLLNNKVSDTDTFARLRGLSQRSIHDITLFERHDHFSRTRLVIGHICRNETSVCVVALQSHYAESKYGAYVFDGTYYTTPQPADILAYTVLENTTTTHGTGIYMNVSR